MERLEHATILRERIAFIIKHPHLLPTPHHPFPKSIFFYRYIFIISPSPSIIPISFPFYRYTDANISPYSHIHLYSHISIPISLFIFHFSNFLPLFHLYSPCISCIIKLYKICITEYFSCEYKHTTYHKNRLKRRLGVENGYIPICGQFEYICL